MQPDENGIAIVNRLLDRLEGPRKLRLIANDWSKTLSQESIRRFEFFTIVVT